MTKSLSTTYNGDTTHLSVLTAIFPGGPGLGPFTECLRHVFLLELRMMEVVATTGAISRAKLQ